MEIRKRSYRVLIGKGGAAREFTNVGSNGVDLQITFEVTREHTPDPNVTRIELYNLSDETRSQIEGYDTYVELYAGYETTGPPSLISSGFVVDSSTERRDAEQVTRIDVYDGWVPLRDTKISVSYKKGASAMQVIKGVASAMKARLSVSKGVTDHVYQSGFSFMGSPHSALTKACAAAGLKWSIQNGAIQITRLLHSTQRRAVVLSPGSGMIGSPERIYKSAQEAQPQKSGKKRPQGVQVISTDPEKQKRRGWRVHSLLRAEINPGDLVVIESMSASGTYVAESVKHSGDYYGDRWTTEVELFEDQTGTYTYEKEHGK